MNFDYVMELFWKFMILCNYWFDFLCLILAKTYVRWRNGKIFAFTFAIGGEIDCNFYMISISRLTLYFCKKKLEVYIRKGPESPII